MNRIASTKGAEYVRVYENMGGMGKHGDAPEKRYAYTENMYRDRHSDDGALESVPGFRRLYSFDGKINAIHKWTLGDGKQFIFIHSGTSLYRFEKEEYESLEELEPIASLRDSRSSAVAFERSFYILDGEKITVVDENGGVRQIGSSADENLYTPLCYSNTEVCESRNMLTDKFTESYLVSSAANIKYGTPELVYGVIDAENKYCTVVGIRQGHGKDVYVPASVILGKETYRVKAIEATAFMYNQTISSITVSEGVESVGSFCFWGCTSLTSAVIGNTVSSVGSSAFYGCTSLKYFFMGIGVQIIGSSIFKNCSLLTEIDYAGNSEMFSAIGNNVAVGARTINYEAKYEKAVVKIPVISDAKAISSVTVDGKECDFEFSSASGGVILSLDNKHEIEGRQVLVSGTLKAEADEIRGPDGERVPPAEAIIGCTVCEVFDGRLFISGNPRIPGAVFYSHVNERGEAVPLYFASNARFADGSGDYNTVSLISTGENLVVFKSGDDGSGSIFYHRAEQTKERRTYPLSYVHGKLCALGDAYLFLSDAVFLSKLGLTRLKRAGNDYKTPLSESESINHLLLKDRTENVRFAEWEGYLVLSVGDKMYLADARDRMLSGKNTEYEWYYLCGIGSYKNDTRVYRYSYSSKTGYITSDRRGEMVNDTIYSTTDENGSPIFYVTENKKRVLVDRTDEYTGGDFYPATEVAAVDELLFFGTECGDLCVFNNDKVGVFPEDSCDGANTENKLHKSYYSFLGHTARYALKTVPDELGACYFEKSTVPSSLIIKLKNLDGSSFRCEIITDKSREELGVCPSKSIAFDDADFSAFTTTVPEKITVAVNDRSRRFFEKQIALCSDAYASPFGVYSISYRYTVEDTVKKSNM